MIPNFAYAENWYKIKFKKYDFGKVFLILVLFVLTTWPTFADSQMGIFSDSNFTTPTTEFSAGQTVYIKIDSDDPGENERVVKLKDNQYRDISTFQLSREGEKPYIYKVSFAAPNTSGFYSIEATIASSGSQSKLVKTIQVGSPSSANTQVNVRAQVQGTKSQRMQTPTPTETPTPISEAEVDLPQLSTSTPATAPIVNFWQRIIEFFQNIFKFFL